jgi:hypothetical protein
LSLFDKEWERLCQIVPGIYPGVASTGFQRGAGDSFFFQKGIKLNGRFVEEIFRPPRSQNSLPESQPGGV